VEDFMSLGLVAIISSIIVLPGMILSFIYALKRLKSLERQALMHREVLEAEANVERLKLQRLDSENRKMDRLIQEREKGNFLEDVENV
jgi:hypothetical protein